MINNIEAKTHSNDTCPFERVSLAEVKPATTEENCECEIYLPKFGHKVLQELMKIKDIALESNRLCWSFWVVSGLGLIGHFGFTGYLIHLYKGNGNVAIYSVFLASIFCYTLINAYFTRTLALSQSYEKTIPVFVAFLLLIYTGLFVASVVLLFLDGYIKYGVISCILFALGIYAIGFFMLTIVILTVLWIIMSFLEVTVGMILRGILYLPYLLFKLIAYLIYIAFCKDICCFNSDPNSKDRPLNCSLFYYDQNKTTVTQCTICLCDFKSKAEICVGKCHVTHIFHAKCLNDWLKSKKNCPICTSISGFR